MKKIIFIFVMLLLVGCDTPQEQNKKEIENIKLSLNEISERLDKIKIPNTSNLKAKISDLETKINKLDNSSLKSEINTLSIKLENLQQQLNNIKKENNNQTLNEKLNKIQKEINNLKNKKSETKNDNYGYIIIKPVTLITIKDTNIYSKPNTKSKIIKKFQKLHTFTSYKEQNGFIKITGYFINKRWVENDKSWWIKKSDCKIKIMEK